MLPAQLLTNHTSDRLGDQPHAINRTQSTTSPPNLTPLLSFFITHTQLWVTGCRPTTVRGSRRAAGACGTAGPSRHRPPWPPWRARAGTWHPACTCRSAPSHRRRGRASSGRSPPPGIARRQRRGRPGRSGRRRHGGTGRPRWSTGRAGRKCSPGHDRDRPSATAYTRRGSWRRRRAASRRTAPPIVGRARTGTVCLFRSSQPAQRTGTQPWPCRAALTWPFSSFPAPPPPRSVMAALSRRGSRPHHANLYSFASACVRACVRDGQGVCECKLFIGGGWRIPTEATLTIVGEASADGLWLAKTTADCNAK